MIVKASVPVLVLFMSEKCRDAASLNISQQLGLFLLTSHLPALMTWRMSWVDVSWPWGLVTIGLVPLFSAKSLASMDTRTWLVSGAYILSGLRMGLGAVYLAYKGHLAKELPRYEYQRIRWAKRGVTKDKPFLYMLTLQAEIFVQCLANMGLLSVPLMLQSSGYLTGPLTPLETLSWGLWAISLCWEHLADSQKINFARQCKMSGSRGAVCDVGLWQYCRHPNYFGEWMVWNSLALASAPSCLAMLTSGQESSLLVRLGLVASLLQVSLAMYTCLVTYTGAVPSEHYSLQKRPEYARYQQEVNMFFPGPNKK